jgi:kynurenine--oxoglutarate transaminase/cysteine-S-conjugate beta-lyase/glutamine--phenylpyruvate transaminase
MEKFALSKKYHGLEKNVWVEFVKLALEYKPLNLGQGLPDDLVPEYVLQSLAGKYTDDFVFPGLKRHNRDCHIQRK